ncbi:MAG: hypothetical protein ABIR60_12295 [Allosphingosinicella sp.]
MHDTLADALAILVACLAIAGAASALILLRPAARRRRRHKRHSRRPKIDLFKAEAAGPEPGTDA